MVFKEIATKIGVEGLKKGIESLENGDSLKDVLSKSLEGILNSGLDQLKNLLDNQEVSDLKESVTELKNINEESIVNPEGLKAQGPEIIEQFTTIENTLENTVNEVKTAVSEDPSIFEEVKGFLNELKEVIDLLKEVKDKLREIGIDLDPISDVLQNFDPSSVESFLGENFDEQDKEEETED